MAYADYDFYTDTYYGNVVPESDFPRLAERASEEIDRLTNDRLTEWMPEKEKDVLKIKKACCALAERLYYNDLLTAAGMASVGQTDGHGKIIASKSVSSMNESINESYATGGVSASSLEGAAVQQMIKDAEGKARGYLSGIMYKDKGYSVLFMGIGYE